MNLKIWSKEESENENADQLFLKLEYSKEDGEKTIKLLACDKNGELIESGHLLFIDSILRTIIIASNPNEIIPLKTDAFNEIITVKASEIRERGMNSLSGIIKIMDSFCDESEKESHPRNSTLTH